MKTSWSGTKPAKTAFLWRKLKTAKSQASANGCCADTDYLADALYHDATLHNPDGDYQMIFRTGRQSEVPETGHWRSTDASYGKSAGERDKKAVVLTCKDHMIPFYKRIGYEYIELSDSTHGGAKWHKMMYRF